MLGLNALFAFGSAASGRRLDPYFDFNYLVEIDGLLTGGFSKVDGLGGRIEVETVHDGGNHQGPRHQLGETTWDNIVLSHGLAEIDTLWNWFEATARGVIRRKSGTIILLDRKLVPVTLWNFRDALPVVWTGPSLDATSSQIAVERVELVHRGLSKPALVTAASYARAIARLATGKESLF
jgi:phage tail-like protein